VIAAEEQVFVEKLVPHPAVEALAEAVLHRFIGAIKCQAIRLTSDQASMALQMNSVPCRRRSCPGLPR
jgi:hypothetical protein